MTRVALSLVFALALVSATEALDVATADYQRAAAQGRVGVVVGRAAEEARRRNAADTPLSGFSVTLVPRSTEFLARLRAIAHRGRTDPAAYALTAPAIAAARKDYERALEEAGAGQLVKNRTVEADGRFEVRDVPEGEWLLVALRPVFVAKPSPPERKAREKQAFTPQPRISGYYAVTVWLRELSVTVGRETEVQLTDRTAWMTAIEEKPVPGAGP
ncbi:MAG TPA: hypothetical protein VLF19_07235 [Methylomirabilota bacterium]|nr:hypothetical protein [Methylomirabilota bacterium]